MDLKKMCRRLQLGKNIVVFCCLFVTQFVSLSSTLSTSPLEFRNEKEFLPPLRLPSRPASPMLSQTTDSEIIMIVSNPPRFIQINYIESEYRQVMKVTSDSNKQFQDFIDWNKGPYKAYENNINDTNVLTKTPITLVLKNLFPKTQYEVRIRMNNSIGYSAYSIPLIASTRINISQSVIPLNITFPAVSQSYIDVNISVISETTTDVPLGSQRYQLQYRPTTFAAVASDITNTNQVDWQLYPNLFQFQPRQSGVYIQQFSSRAESISDMSATSHCSGYFWLTMPLKSVAQSTADNIKKWLIATEPLKWDATATEFYSSLRSIGLIRYHMDQGTLTMTVERDLNVFNGYTWTVRMTGSAVALFTTTLSATVTADAPYPLFPLSIYKHTLILQKDVVVTNTTASGSVSLMSVSQGACWPSDPNHPILTKVLNSGVDIFSNDHQTVRVDNLSSDTYYQFRLQLFNDLSETTTVTSSADYYLYSNIATTKTLALDTSYILSDSRSMLSLLTQSDRSNLLNILSSIFRNSLTGTSSSTTNGSSSSIGTTLTQFLSSSAITVAGYGSSPGNQQDYYYYNNNHYKLAPSSFSTSTSIGNNSNNSTSSSNMIGVGGISGENGGDGYCVAIIQHGVTAVNEEMNLMTLKTVPFSYIEGCTSSSSGSSHTANADEESCIYQFSVASYITSNYITAIKSTTNTLTKSSSSSLSSSLYVTFKCWGGGGGGGKLSDLLNNDQQQEHELLLHLSSGGGAGFAQLTIPVQVNDVFAVHVGGGGQSSWGERGAEGGWNGGGRGGDAVIGTGGAGGGGASIIKRISIISTSGNTTTVEEDVLVLVASGGGGGGSTDYCCSNGAAGGNQFGSAAASATTTTDSSFYFGHSPGSNTPWPLTSDTSNTPVSQRYDYTSHNCPTGVDGDWCLSIWDTLPSSLPPTHTHLQYGHNPQADYSVWSTGGESGSNTTGGNAGVSGGYMIKIAGAETSEMSRSRIAAVYSVNEGIRVEAGNGRYLTGGNGGGGKEGGGGGGAGYYGGGGGGGGIDAAGGGGGSSYVNASLIFGSSSTTGSSSLLSSLITSLSSSSSSSRSTNEDVPSSTNDDLWQLHTERVWDTGAVIQWSSTSSSSTQQRVSIWELEYAIGRFSDDFVYLDRVVMTTGTTSGATATTEAMMSYTLHSLSPVSIYRFRVIPVTATTGRGVPSTPPLTVTTFPSPRNYWEQVYPRRYTQANVGRGYAYPVTHRPYLDVDPRTGLLLSSLSSTTTAGGNNSNRSSGVVHDGDSSDMLLRATDTDTPTAESGPILPAGRRGHSLTAVTITTNTATTSVTSVVYMFGGRSNGDSCSLGFRDMTNLGAEQQSGIPIDPCVDHAGEVNELWRLDLRTYTWKLIQPVILPSLLLNSTNSTNNAQTNNSTVVILPPPREQHTATLMGNDIYIFGGKTTNIVNNNNNDDMQQQSQQQTVLNDFWKLQLPRVDTLTLSWPSPSQVDNSSSSIHTNVTNTNGLEIPQDTALRVPMNYMDGNGIISITNSSNSTIDDGRRLDRRYGKCINKLTVQVRLTHSCANQLRVSLLGPGPQTSSPNYFSPSSSSPSSSFSQYEVLLYDRAYSNNTANSGCISGVQNIVFDNDVSQTTYINLQSQYNGRFKPVGRLSDFIGASASSVSYSMSGNSSDGSDSNILSHSRWTLIVQDMNADNHSGSLLSWNMEMTVTDCVEKYTWVNMPSSLSSDVLPSPRYNAKTIAYQHSFFLFGGRGMYDEIHHDLYRYDTITNVWVELTPVRFDKAWNMLYHNSVFGSSFVLSPGGLVTFGGYSVADDDDDVDDNESNNNMNQQLQSLSLYDPVTEQWSSITIPSSQQPQSSISSSSSTSSIPFKRHLYGMSYISSHQVSWLTSFSASSLYTPSLLPSHQLNKIGSIVDSILVVGGSVDATGSTQGGTTAGFLNDMWMLRLPTLSTAEARIAQQEYIRIHCAFRNKAVYSSVFGKSSNSSTISSQQLPCFGESSLSSCSFRDLILLPWCGLHNQSL